MKQVIPASRILVFFAALALAVTSASCASTATDRSKGRRAPGASPSAGSLENATNSEQVDSPVESRRADGTRRRANGSVVGGGSDEQRRAGAPASVGTAPEGRGFDRERISIGIETLADLSGNLNAIGSQSQSPGETQQHAQAIVDFVNADGGIAGREVHPVYYAVDSNSSSWDGQAQAACASFTEDHHTFAVVSAFLSQSYVLPTCLKAKSTPLMLQGRLPVDDVMLREFDGYLYVPGRMSGSRWGRHAIDRLDAAGYFSSSARIGLARFNTPVHERIVERVVKPRLNALNVTIAHEAVVSRPDSVGQFSRSGAEISSIILAMRSARVTHVILIDDHGVLSFLFMTEAEGQEWRPRYGLNSANQLTSIEANRNPSYLQGAIATGWLPSEDTHFGWAGPVNPAQAKCFDILRRSGIDVDVSATARATSTAYCDGLFFLKQALDEAEALSITGLQRAVARMKTSYVSPLTFHTNFSTRADGAAAVRDLTYDVDCGCFRYTGSVIGVS